jgi:hypothetical protein
MRRGLAGRVGRAGPSTVMANFAFCVVWPTDARRPGRAGLLAHQRRDRSGPRWGRDRAVNDWSTADNHGRPQGIIFQLPRRSTAGHGRQAIRSDTEQVTGSNPVAPTIQALTSGNAGQFAVHLTSLAEESVSPFGKSSTKVGSSALGLVPLPAPFAACFTPLAGIQGAERSESA